MKLLILLGILVLSACGEQAQQQAEYLEQAMKEKEKEHHDEHEHEHHEHDEHCGHEH